VGAGSAQFLGNVVVASRIVGKPMQENDRPAAGVAVLLERDIDLGTRNGLDVSHAIKTFRDR
jgi:hypothetical protein